jgi:hypothetical protein
MAYIRAIFRLLFRADATSRAIRGGGGPYNEQCHPQRYGT